MNVQLDDYQSKLWKKLDKNKTLVVSMRSPYDIKKLEKLQNVENYICIYEATQLALESLVETLIDNTFYGIIPVKL